MTDEKATTTIGTQTPLPQTCLSFSSLTGNTVANQKQQKSNSNYSPFEQKILENELLLQTQRNALKNIDRILIDERIIDKSIDRKNVERTNELEQPTNFELHRGIDIDQTAIRMVGNKI